MEPFRPLSIVLIPFDLLRGCGRNRFLWEQRATVNSLVSQILFDTNQLIVFCHAITTRSRTGFDLAGVQSYGKIGNRRVLGLAAAMAGNTRVAISTR